VSTFFSAILSGGALFGMLMYTSVQFDPMVILQFMKPPASGGFLFFVVFNTTMELFMYPLIFLRFTNKSKQLRNVLCGSGVLFYFCRAWSYIYFIPLIMESFLPLAIQSPLSLTHVQSQEIVTWTQLSWLRCILDNLASVLLFCGIYIFEEAQKDLLRRKIN